MPASVPAAAEPSRKIFDPWNSASTGHQRAESRESGSTSWRAHRTAKLRQQFGGSGAPDDNGRSPDPELVLKALGPGETVDPVGEARARKGIANTGNIAEWMRSGGKRGCATALRPRNSPKPTGRESPQGEAASDDEAAAPRAPPIFANLTFYINGSTAPKVSDHRLKQLISQYGGQVALGHARRTVTHVVIGKPNTGPGSGSGGGLAATKIEKEVRSRNRGSGVGPRFVSVDWILESIDAGKRLSESAFPGVRTAPAGVKSVRNAFLKDRTPIKSGGKESGIGKVCEPTLLARSA